MDNKPTKKMLAELFGDMKGTDFRVQPVIATAGPFEGQMHFLYRIFETEDLEIEIGSLKSNKQYLVMPVSTLSVSDIYDAKVRVFSGPVWRRGVYFFYELN